MAQQWLSASDPFFSQYPGTYDESGYVAGPYDSQVAGLQSPQNWEAVAPQLGWTGPLKAQYIGPDGNVMEDYSPEFLNWIQSKRAEGYDFVTDASQINKDRQTIGFRLPTGEVTNQRTVKVSGFGDFFKEFVLPSFAAYGAVNFLGPRLEGLTNALSGGGQLSAADLANIPTGTVGQASQSPALSTLTEPVASVTTPAAQLTDASNAMQLRPLTQLQPITQTPNALAGIEGLAGVPVDPAFAAGMGVDAGMAALAPATGTAVGAAGGKTALEALGGSLQAGGTPGALGSALGSTTAALATGAGAAMTGIPFLDKAIDFVTSPAGSAIVSGVGNVVGGIAAGSAAKEAAQTQAASADAALQLQRDIYNKFMEMNKPYYEAGVNALGQITRGEVTAEPGYGFRLGEGMKALERLQASRGNLLSGGALKAGQRFAQDLASEEYGKSFNRLAQIAGFGTGATSRAGEAGQNYASQAGELGMQGANALVSGRIGRTSAYTSGAQGAINALQGYQQEQQRNQLMRDIFGRLQG